MAQGTIEQLTARERDCLRLVARGMSSKEIALELGLSPLTVDGYLKEAVRTLGAATRREAARMLIAHEGDAPQNLGADPAPLAEPLPVGVPCGIL